MNFTLQPEKYFINSVIIFYFYKTLKNVLFYENIVEN